MTGLIQLGRGRVHGHLWPILQTAVAAVGAWYLAALLGVEHRPAFASIAAVISLGAAFVERRRRAVQLIAGRPAREPSQPGHYVPTNVVLKVLCGPR
jgi:hypothetical protein